MKEPLPVHKASYEISHLLRKHMKTFASVKLVKDLCFPGRTEISFPGHRLRLKIMKENHTFQLSESLELFLRDEIGEL